MKGIARKIILVTVILLVYIEMKPFFIQASSVFTTVEETQIRLYVVINNLLKVDEEKLVEEIVAQHQKINGIEKNTIYELILYRTFVHYRGNWEYDTITCDENGAIICCKEDSGV